MSLPKAVASSVKNPGVYVSVDLLGNAASPGTTPLKAIIISPKNTDGNITNDTEVRRVTGPSDVSISHGLRSPAFLLAKALFRKCPTAIVDVVSPTPSAGANATGTFTLVGTATANENLHIDICGREFDSAWPTGNDPTAQGAQLAADITKAASLMDIPVSASNLAGVVTVTANGKGPWGNDITIAIKITTAGTGLTATASGARLAGGTTEPNFTTALTALQTTEYRVMIAQLSNADALDATTASNAHKLKTHIQTYQSGLDALLQIGLVGLTPNSTATPATAAVARNFEPMEYAFGYNFRSLPCELAGDEAGDMMKWHSLRANYNRIGNKCLGIYGSANVNADKLTPGELESLLTQGVTPFNYEKGSNDVLLVRPITTHSQSNAAADYRAFDMSDVFGMYAVVDDIRTALPQEFPRCSISPDLPAGADPLPPNVVELRDVKNFVIGRLGKWTTAGVVLLGKLQAAIADGSLAIEIDPGDATQVNLFLPMGIIAPLAKFSVVASKQQATA